MKFEKTVTILLIAFVVASFAATAVRIIHIIVEVAIVI